MRRHYHLPSRLFMYVNSTFIQFNATRWVVVNIWILFSIFYATELRKNSTLIRLCQRRRTAHLCFLFFSSWISVNESLENLYSWPVAVLSIRILTIFYRKPAKTILWSQVVVINNLLTNKKHYINKYKILCLIILIFTNV